jgi:paraquat-inducible protein B
MADPGPTPQPGRPQAPTPQATVRRSRRLHLAYVWLVPIIAAAVGGYLFYQTEIDVGPTIEIGFADGTNITKGSKVVYRGVEVGSVQSVELDSGLQHVNVVVQLHKPAAGLAREGSQFWIVEPRISVGQVTGLNTLLSGSYIEVAPGDGAEATRFVGLADPPVLDPRQADLLLYLEADDVASLTSGSPILYRGIEVGEIAALSLPPDGTRVQLQVAIAAEHASLVRTNSVFWRTSGVHFDLQPLDPKIDISSVESLIRGGVAFATPGPPGGPAGANALFELLDEPPAGSVIAPKPGLHVVLTAGQLGSIAVGNPVYYREVQVGEVIATGLESDAAAAEVHVLIWERYAPLVQEGTMFWNASGLRVHASLFSGATLDLESLASLLAGGVAFATPEQQGTPVKDGSQFALHDHPKDKWLEWRPVVELGPAPTALALAEGFSVQDMSPATYTVTTASHVREGPDTLYPVLTTLNEGTTVPVTGKVEGRDWYRVELGDSVGYIWAKLLEPVQSAAAQQGR